MNRPTDKRITELCTHFRYEYDKEIESILETRVVGGYEDLMFDALTAMEELLKLRALVKEWQTEADKIIDLQISSMANDATHGWREVNTASWELVRKIHTYEG